MALPASAIVSRIGGAIRIPPERPFAIYDTRTLSTVEHMLSVRDSTNGTKVRGVYAPDHAAGGSNWLLKPGSPGNERRVKAEFDTGPALQALTHKYAGDAHHLPYGLKAGRGMVRPKIPRANKRTEGGSSISGMDWIQNEIDDLFFDVLSFDLDNPEVPDSKPKKKKPNTPESIAHWTEQLLRPELDGTEKDITKNGARVRVFFATRVYGWQTYEAIYRTGMSWINSIGWTSFDEPVMVDPSCCDATRLIRLPFVVREGTNRPFVPPLIDLRITPRDFVPTWETVPERAPRAHVVRSAVPYVFTSAAPPEHLVPRVTPATLEHHTATRHQCMASAASMLLARGVPPEHVPSVIVEMGRRMGLPEEHVRDDRTYAENTCERHRTGAKDNTGGGHLYKHCPALAEAIDALSLGIAVDKLAEIAARSVPMLPTEAIYASTVAAMSAACNQDATVIIDPPAGTGKTEAVTEIALECAAGAHPAGRSGDKQIGRARRTAYVAPRQDNLRDYQKRAWDKRRLPVLRLTSAASERWEAGDIGFDGQPATPGDPVCYAHANVVAFGGAQNIKLPFCDGGGVAPCPHRAYCRAATGAVDHEQRPVELEQGWNEQHPHIAATQARLGVALQHLGASGKLFSDERLELCALDTLADDAIGTTLAALHMFEDDYAAAMRGVLVAVRARIASHEPYEPSDFAAFVGPAATDAARAADPDRARRERARGFHIPSTAPPIKPQYAGVRDGTPTHVKRLGEASKVLELVWTRLQEKAERSTVQVVMTKRQERELYVAWTDAHVTEALTARTSTTILLDASARDSLPEYQAKLGTVTIESLNAQDAGSVTRRLVVTRYGSKSSVTNKLGLFVPGGHHVDLVREAVRALAASPLKVAPLYVVITWKPLSLILLATLGVDVTAEWKAVDQSPSYLKPLAEEMRVVLAEVPGGIGLGGALCHNDIEWYGAIRGLDVHRSKNTCVTIGDPIPSINATGTQAAHLALPEADASTMGIRYARAELGQAQERIRTKRPRLPAYAVHVGRGVVGEDAHPIYPSGWEGTRFVADRAEGGTIRQKIEAGRAGGRPANVGGEERELRQARLADARDRAGNARALAEVLGITESAVQKYASGQRGVPDAVDADVRNYSLRTNPKAGLEIDPTRGAFGFVPATGQCANDSSAVPRTSPANDRGAEHPANDVERVHVAPVPTPETEGAA